ncbi:hypothetical protein HDV05_002571 [Chytridiales sp. JEL 0842]|nr:hypothetical protein HDV05_002571 [Chytridiales sp. JEL 0842]
MDAPDRATSASGDGGGGGDGGSRGKISASAPSSSPLVTMSQQQAFTAALMAKYHSSAAAGRGGPQDIIQLPPQSQQMHSLSPGYPYTFSPMPPLSPLSPLPPHHSALSPIPTSFYFSPSAGSEGYLPQYAMDYYTSPISVIPPLPPFPASASMSSSPIQRDSKSLTPSLASPILSNTTQLISPMRPIDPNGLPPRVPISTINSPSSAATTTTIKLTPGKTMSVTSQPPLTQMKNSNVYPPTSVPLRTSSSPSMLPSSASASPAVLPHPPATGERTPDNKKITISKKPISNSRKRLKDSEEDDDESYEVHLKKEGEEVADNQKDALSVAAARITNAKATRRSSVSTYSILSSSLSLSSSSTTLSSGKKNVGGGGKSNRRGSLPAVFAITSPKALAAAAEPSISEIAASGAANPLHDEDDPSSKPSTKKRSKSDAPLPPKNLQLQPIVPGAQTLRALPEGAVIARSTGTCSKDDGGVSLQKFKAALGAVKEGSLRRRKSISFPEMDVDVVLNQDASVASKPDELGKSKKISDLETIEDPVSASALSKAIQAAKLSLSTSTEKLPINKSPFEDYRNTAPLSSAVSEKYTEMEDILAAFSPGPIDESFKDFNQITSTENAFSCLDGVTDMLASLGANQSSAESQPAVMLSTNAQEEATGEQTADANLLNLDDLDWFQNDLVGQELLGVVNVMESETSYHQPNQNSQPNNTKDLELNFEDYFFDTTSLEQEQQQPLPAALLKTSSSTSSIFSELEEFASPSLITPPRQVKDTPPSSAKNINNDRSDQPKNINNTSLPQTKKINNTNLLSTSAPPLPGSNVIVGMPLRSATSFVPMSGVSLPLNHGLPMHHPSFYPFVHSAHGGMNSLGTPPLSPAAHFHPHNAHHQPHLYQHGIIVGGYPHVSSQELYLRRAQQQQHQARRDLAAMYMMQASAAYQRSAGFPDGCP